MSISERSSRKVSKGAFIDIIGASLALESRFTETGVVGEVWRRDAFGSSRAGVEETRVERHVTPRAREGKGTETSEAIHTIQAGATIDTRVGFTFIDVHLTPVSSVTRTTGTFESIITSGWDASSAMRTRVQVAGRSRFHPSLTSLSSVGWRTDAGIVATTRMVSTDTVMEAGRGETVILIMGTSSSIVSRWTDTHESGSLVDTSCSIHANRSGGFTFIYVKGTSRSCESRRTVAPVTVDQIRAGSIVKTRIGPAVIDIHFTPRTFCSRRTETLESSSVPIQQLVVELSPLCVMVVPPEGRIVLITILDRSIGCVQIHASTAKHAGRGKTIIHFLMTQLPRVPDRTFTLKLVYTIYTRPMDARIVGAFINVRFACREREGEGERMKKMDQNCEKLEVIRERGKELKNEAREKNDG